MVGIQDVRASNSSLKASTSDFVALFAGGTAGIGRSTLTKLVEHTSAPKVYIIGRNEKTVSEIQAELKKLNAGGEYVFVEASNLSLLHVVDQVCDFVKKKESKLDLLWLSAGYLSAEGRQETSEGLDALLAVRYYSRMRFIYNLLPLLNAAPNPRVVSVLAAGQEGKVFPDDLGLKENYGFINCSVASATYMTLCMEKFAEENPKVSFVHYYPGLVKTNVFNIRGLGRLAQFLIDWVVLPLITPMSFSFDEAGERGLYYATAAKYPPVQGANFYGLDQNGEPAHNNKVLDPMRQDGTKGKIWDHTLQEFDRIAAL